jgi:hypothetical protein
MTGAFMGRQVEIGGIWIDAYTAFCANHCRYCQVGIKRLSNISFSRFAAIVERFVAWQETCDLPDFKTGFWLGYAHNYNVATLSGIRALQKLTAQPFLDLILLGGVIHRPDDEIRAWIEERRNIGIEKVTASFSGYGDSHDRWNGRRGDFNFLMRAQRIAAELGMQLHQKIFLTRSTLPLLDELLDRLDMFPGAAERHAHPLFYCGHASRMEDERLTEEELNNIPERLRKLLRFDWHNWRTERGWMDTVQVEGEKHERVLLKLILDDDNIQRFESMSCDEIVTKLAAATSKAYAAIPTRAELCRKHGDPTNTRVYMFRMDMECKWLDSYLQDRPITFDRQLTHLAQHR